MNRNDYFLRVFLAVLLIFTLIILPISSYVGPDYDLTEKHGYVNTSSYVSYTTNFGTGAASSLSLVGHPYMRYNFSEKYRPIVMDWIGCNVQLFAGLSYTNLPTQVTDYIQFYDGTIQVFTFNVTAYKLDDKASGNVGNVSFHFVPYFINNTHIANRTGVINLVGNWGEKQVWISLIKGAVSGTFAEDFTIDPAITYDFKPYCIYFSPAATGEERITKYTTWGNEYNVNEIGNDKEFIITRESLGFLSSTSRLKITDVNDIPIYYSDYNNTNQYLYIPAVTNVKIFIESTNGVSYSIFDDSTDIQPYFTLSPNVTPVRLYAPVKWQLTATNSPNLPSDNYIKSIRWYEDTSVSDTDDNLYFYNDSGTWKKYNATYPTSYVISSYAEAIAPTLTAPNTGDYVVHAGIFDKNGNLLQIVDYETTVISSTNQANLQVWVLDLSKSGHSLIPDSSVSIKDEVLNTTTNYTATTGLINVALYQGRYYSVSASKSGYAMYLTPTHIVGGVQSTIYVYLYPTTGVNLTRFYIQDSSGNPIDSASVYVENIDNSTAPDFALTSNSNGYAYCAPFMGETYQYSVTKEGYIGYTNSFNNLAATTITVTLYRVGEVTTTATPTPIPTTATVITTATPVVTITPPPAEEGWVGYIKWLVAKQGVKTSFSQNLLTGILMVFICAIICGGSLALLGAKSAAGYGFIVGGLLGMVTSVALDLLPLWFVLVGVLFIGVIGFIMLKD